MKKIINFHSLLWVFFFLVFNNELFAQQKNIISTKFEQAYTTNSFWSDLQEWRKTEHQQIQSLISNIPPQEKDNILKNADKANTYQWPSLTAALYMDYKLTGTRVNYEVLSNERQQNLSVLAMGALLSSDDKYISQLANGLWLTLEQSTWVAPAHIAVQKNGVGLPDVNTKYIDLNASRIGYRVALIYFLLKEKLDKYSKVLNRRIEVELQKRIYEPYLENDRFFWQGLNGGKVNNWNTFNNSNCLDAVLYACNDKAIVEKLVPKILKSTDAFLNHYPADGGCDEGPSYWDMAGGKLISLVSALQEVSKNKIDFSKQQLIHNIGAYIYKVHIAANKWTNFADAQASHLQNPTNVFCYGQLFNDLKLKQFASFLNIQKGNATEKDLMSFIETLKIRDSLTMYKPIAPYPLQMSLPNLEVFAGRQIEGSTQGFYYAIKGGNNNESHNHNDIGNFIVYDDGEPLLIDAGVGTYTAQTFSNRRYELWNVQSAWHNCPLINGVEQKDGAKFKAENLVYSQNNKKDVISMDIAYAYPKKAAVDSWLRTFIFDRANAQIEIKEQFKLQQLIQSNELHFIALNRPIVEKNTILLSKKVQLQFDDKQFDIVVDEKIMEDERFKKIWGDKIFRIILRAKKLSKENTYKVILKHISNKRLR